MRSVCASASSSLTGAEPVKGAMCMRGRRTPNSSVTGAGSGRRSIWSSAGEVGDEHELRARYARNAQHPQSAHLELAADRRRSLGHDAVARAAQVDAVVGNERRGAGNERGRGYREAAQRQVGFARPRRAADERRVAAERNRRPVDVLNCVGQPAPLRAVPRWR